MTKLGIGLSTAKNAENAKIGMVICTYASCAFFAVKYPNPIETLNP